MTLEDALSFREGPQRTAAIVAWIQSLFFEQGQVPVLVGGAAVEILTGGAYTTGDLDFVGYVPPAVGRALEAGGFTKSGRHWINEKAQIFLEFPGDSLDPNEKSIQIEAFGYDLTVVSLEDLLVDRLGAWAYWKSGVDGANAFVLYRTRLKEIDDERLSQRAREEGFENALDALRAFHSEWPKSDPDPDSLERWANSGPPEDSS